MGRKYLSYTRQFKEQAMDLVRVEGRGPAAAARGLGIPTTSLRRWLTESGWVPTAELSAPLPEDPAALKVRVAELERQVKRLEVEREIFKKSERNWRLPANATAFFASQSP